MKLSIVMPVYNVEKYLEKCLDSIINMDFEDYEVILVDDGSADSSGMICDRYASNYSHIRVFHRENEGPSKARNFGISVANGEYIQFVDSDDAVTSDYAKKFSALTEEKTPDLILGNAEIFGGNDNLIRHLYLQKKGTMNPYNMFSQMTSLDKELYLHYIWNKWYKTETVKRYGIQFNEKVRLGEDFLFNCNFYKGIENVFLTNKVMYHYYKRGNETLSGKFNIKEIERRRLMDGAFLNLLRTIQVYETKKELYDVAIGEITLESIRSINREDCKLKNKEKKHYIRTFLDSEYYGYLMALRKVRTNKLWKKILLYLASKKAAGCIVTLLNIKKVLETKR